MSIALTGITCGSFAWFTYMTRAKIEEFQGVTVGFGNLQAGFISDVDLPEAEQYGLVRDDSTYEQTIYWIDGHTIEPDTMHYFLGMNGYATDTLHPVTTRKYQNGESLSALYSAPRTLYDSTDQAEKADYIHLPFVFRYEDIIDEGTFIGDENIYLSQVKLNVTNSSSHIHESIRIHTDNHIENIHMINPSSSDDGSTNVGGTLDLNGDGYYDSTYVGTDRYEFIYGQLKESPQYNDFPEVDDTPIFDDTFHSGHKSGVYAVKAIDPEVAEYEGMYEFRNKRKFVTTTNPHTNNLAFLDLSIFVEGWDLSVIDSEIGIPFSMELKFETDN